MLAVAKAEGMIGVEEEWGWLATSLVSRGSTKAFQGPWNGLPSTSRISSDGRIQNQLGSEYILFLRILRVCNFSSALKALGRVVRPVESAMSTRRDAKFAMKTGSALSGLDETLSSSRFIHDSSAGGRALRKLADMSRASKVLLIMGKLFVIREGKALGVLEEPTRRWVVPG